MANGNLLGKRSREGDDVQSHTRSVRDSTKRQRKESTSELKKRKRWWMSKDNVFHPQNRIPGYKRKGMSSKVDNRLTEEYDRQILLRKRSIEEPYSRAATLMRFDNSLDQSKSKRKKDLKSQAKKGLKALGISRNHIIADSQHSIIMNEAGKKIREEKVRKMKSSQARQSVENYLSVLHGGREDEVKESMESWNSFLGGGKRGFLNKAIHSSSTGRGNIRYDDARLNTNISFGFDPEFREGKMTSKTIKIRDAIFNMAKNGAIDWETAFNVTSPTIRKEKMSDGTLRGGYLSSSLYRLGQKASLKSMQDDKVDGGTISGLL